MSGLWASRRPFWPWSRGDATTQSESSPLVPKEGQAAVGEPLYGPVGDAGPRYDDDSEENLGSSQSDPKTFTPTDRRRRRRRCQRSLGDHCLKLLLVSSNLLFCVLGLAVLCLGLWGLVTKDSFARERVGGLGTDPMLAFAALGALLSALCLSGCVGALRENGRLLRCFAAAVLALIAAQVLAAIAAFSLQQRGEVAGRLRSGLLVAMARYRDDPDLRFIVDEMQTGLECCGADDYRDWEVNIYYNCSAPGVLACGVPATCCVAPLENGTVWNSQCGVGAQRLDVFSAQSAVFLGGCLGAAARWVGRHSAAIGAAGVVALGVQILTLSAAARLLDTIQWHKAYSRGLPR